MRFLRKLKFDLPSLFILCAASAVPISFISCNEQIRDGWHDPEAKQEFSRFSTVARRELVAMSEMVQEMPDETRKIALDQLETLKKSAREITIPRLKLSKSLPEPFRESTMSVVEALVYCKSATVRDRGDLRQWLGYEPRIIDK